MTPGPARVPVSPWRGSVAGFHHADLLADADRLTVWVADLTDAAIVLGSSQRDDVVDHRAAADRGLDVVRRRSGGGAVLVDPAAMVWFDVIVPAGDHRGLPLDDVNASMLAVGERLAAALAGLGVDDAEVHRGRMERTPTSTLVCFAGLGPGEIVVPDRTGSGVDGPGVDGPGVAGAGVAGPGAVGPAPVGPAGKLVGISQRRTRQGARFQCAVHTRWDPAATVSVLDPARAPAAGELPPVATLAAELAARLPAAFARTFA